MLRHASLLLLLVARGAFGDAYLQVPHGCNNRLDETNNNRQNANRLWDSQNNANAGVNVGDNCVGGVCNNPGNNQYLKDGAGAGEGKMTYVASSILTIEWTAQHGSGYYMHEVDADFIIQYACDDTLPNVRNGRVRTTIPDNETQARDTQYGMHESYKYYQDCKARERNKGLWTADQNMGNRNKAVHTRQDRNENRHGFECPEERDYYPYWHPSPWRDIAILTTDMTRCEMYKKESQNVMPKNYCSDPQYNNEKSCEDGGGSWKEEPAFDIEPPECVQAPELKDNHHGMVVGKSEFPSYNWTIPDDIISDKCVLRIRYNMTSKDFVGWGEDMLTAADNDDLSPVKQNPKKDFLDVDSDKNGPLRLQINTDQYGRVFEDRTYVFGIKERPDDIPFDSMIYNVNVRGRRGNIQQTFPSIEYDFVPKLLYVDQNDYIHFQWTGSDSNNAGNAGNGRQMTDRSNIVQIETYNHNVPLAAADNTMFLDETMQPDEDTILRFAHLDQPVDDPSKCNDTINDTNDPRYCALLNYAPAYFDGGLVKMRNSGTFYYMCTRNNQFSNRDQKAAIVVRPTYWKIVLIVAASILGGVAAVTGAGATGAHYALTHPGSKLAQSGFGKLLIKLFAPVAVLCCIGMCCCCKRRQRRRRLDPELLALYYKDDDTDSHGALKTWYLNNKRSILFLSGYFLINLILASVGFFSYLGIGPITYAFARAGGSMLNFNCALILVPVMRNMISQLLQTPIKNVIPLEHHILFHKIVAGVICFATLLHVSCHYADFFYYYPITGVPVAEQAFLNLPGLTGHVILLIMFLMGVTAIEKVRRKTWSCGKKTIYGFDIFWYTHQMYIFALGLLLFHAPRYWMFLTFPFLFFMVEKLIRKARSMEDVIVVAVKEKPGDVMQIVLRMENFHYRAGQYLYLNVPEISREYHPFTITSAPEEQFVHVHIRYRGDWTRKLHDMLNPDGKKQIDYWSLEKAPKKEKSKIFGLLDQDDTDSDKDTTADVALKKDDSATPSTRRRYADAGTQNPTPSMSKEKGLVRAQSSGQVLRRKDGNGAPEYMPIVNVDGPFGTATEHAFDYDIILLVGAGIGVTPFVSVMNSIRMKQGGFRMQEQAVSTKQKSAFDNLVKPKKCYFYWICRDHQEFEWFSPLFKKIEQDKAMKDTFELNTFVTGEVNLDDLAVDGAKTAKGSGNSMNKFAGRPNWRRIFKDVATEFPHGDCGVFFCGPPAVGHELRKSCKQNSKEDGTRFSFFQETF